MAEAPIRLLLVDDHLVVRKGIEQVLANAPNINIVGEAECGERALAICARLKPDIVLMDIQMKGMSGIDTTRALLNTHTQTRVIGLSTFADRVTVSDMIEAGARGYLLKDVSASEIITTIHRVHTGEILVPQALLSSNNITSPTEQLPELGTQQKRVLALMSKGFTNPEIASTLNISTPTARYHVSAILQKLNVSKRSEAVAFAIRMGFIDYSEL